MLLVYSMRKMPKQVDKGHVLNAHLMSLFAFASWLKCTLCAFCCRSNLGWNMHFGWNVYFEMHIWGSHLHLYFGCNGHILEDVRAFEGSHLYLYFGYDAHLFWRKCTLKYNCIYMFMKEMTLIKYYCNLYHISLRIEEHKTNFANWMHEPHLNLITSHFR